MKKRIDVERYYELLGMIEQTEKELTKLPMEDTLE